MIGKHKEQKTTLIPKDNYLPLYHYKINDLLVSFLGPRPLDIYLKAIPYRLVFGFIAAFLVWVTPLLVPDASQGLPFLYVVFLIGCYALHQVRIC